MAIPLKLITYAEVIRAENREKWEEIHSDVAVSIASLEPCTEAVTWGEREVHHRLHLLIYFYRERICQEAKAVVGLGCMFNARLER